MPAVMRRGAGIIVCQFCAAVPESFTVTDAQVLSAVRVGLLNDFSGLLVLRERIELSTSPLPRECSTAELQGLVEDGPGWI